MLHHPCLSRSAVAPLAGGYGATIPPVVPSAAARPPRAVATPHHDDRQARIEAAKNWLLAQYHVIDCDLIEAVDAMDPEILLRRWEEGTGQRPVTRPEPHHLAAHAEGESAAATVAQPSNPPRERRLADERPLFTAADIDWTEADAWVRGGRPRRDGWPEPGGEAFRALTDRDWRDHRFEADDDLPGPWFAIVVLSLIFGFTVAFGVGLARLVMVLL